MPGLSFAASPSVLVSGLSAPLSVSVPVRELSAAMLKSSATILELSVAVPGLSIPISESITIFELSTAVPGLSAAVLELFIAVLGLFIAMLKLFGAVPRSSLPKTPMPNLVARRQKLDDNISGWSKKSKKVFSEELWKEELKRQL